MVCIHVSTRVCMCRGQKQILTVFLYCSLPYSLGKGLFSELETVWLMSSLRYTCLHPEILWFRVCQPHLAMLGTQC